MIRRWPVLLVALVTLVAIVAACSGDGEERVERDAAGRPAVTTTAPATTVPPTTAPITTVPPPPTTVIDGSVPPDAEVGAVVTPTNVVLPVLGTAPEGFRVRTPCGNQATLAAGTPLRGATVVLDPGHGGVETGAVGANGLTEAALNMAVAERLKPLLERAGATVVLTRTGDYRVTLETRAEIATRLRTRAMVSIHHNGGADIITDRPGTEVFYQIASADSKRLAGLVYEELFRLFDTFDLAFESDRDAGAKYRPNDSGGDYYGMLRRTAGVPAVLSEALFLSNPPEAELLARPETQQAEAEALSRAIIRFLTTQDPGSGFVEPYPRTEPAGPGGGSRGCVDPPLQ